MLLIPKITKTYLSVIQEERIFGWCDCSGPRPAQDAVSKSKFLTLLHQDLQLVRCDAVIYKFRYLTLPKPIASYKENEDDYTRRAIEHLDTEANKRKNICNFIADLGIEPGFDYLLMNYLDNAGYTDHGISIRNSFKKLSELVSGFIYFDNTKESVVEKVWATNINLCVISR